MKTNRIFKLILFFIIISAFLSPIFFAKAQDPVQERQELEDELKRLEEELQKIDQDITKTEKEKKTLQNQINILKQKVNKSNIQIQQSNMMIKDLTLQISDTESSVKQTFLRIDGSQIKLASVLRSIYEEDKKSIVEVLLSESKLSDFFDNLVYLENLSSKS